jgi:hypothetical protein
MLIEDGHEIVRSGEVIGKVIGQTGSQEKSEYFRVTSFDEPPIPSL